MDNTNKELEQIKKELQDIQHEETEKRESDIHLRTIEKLLSIEKLAIYGTLPQKHKRIESEIDKELNNYKVHRNANKEN
tara:strand:+ start:2413 stop:2649 length:237 start_codon:yes stop_codon:yes gene_type:complete